MKNKTKGLLFRIPGIILLFVAVVGSFYVKIKNLMPTPISWFTPIILLIILVIYLIGEYFSMKQDSLF